MTTSTQYATASSIYSPPIVNGVNFGQGTDQALAQNMMNYGPYGSMPDSTESAIASGPSYMFTTQAMENALADVGVDAFSDLNGILMDYDNLLF